MPRPLVLSLARPSCCSAPSSPALGADQSARGGGGARSGRAAEAAGEGSVGVTNCWSWAVGSGWLRWTSPVMGRPKSPQERRITALKSSWGTSERPWGCLGGRTGPISASWWVTTGGGVLAWELAAAHPEVVAKLVVMDAPHRAAMMGFSAHRPTQLLRSSYIFLFQLPWLPELLLSLADFQFLRTLLMGPRLGIQNPSRRMTDPEFEAYLYGLSQPGGLSPPIHYYRNLF
uniref:AB hydrolase-1 domain-containing protein n=1 Tax=Gallus gallus TaxID=9031 RepID=A0A8V0X7Z4_CHICK